MCRLLRGALAALAFVTLLGLGCSGGEPATAVSGKLLENGEPAKPLAGLPPGDKGWRMSFAPEGGDAKSAGMQYALISDDGSFRVDGPNKKGLRPGKYRISVQKGAMGIPTTKTIDLPAVEIPNAKSVTLEVDIGKKTAMVIP